MRYHLHEKAHSVNMLLRNRPADAVAVYSLVPWQSVPARPEFQREKVAHFQNNTNPAKLRKHATNENKKEKKG